MSEHAARTVAGASGVSPPRHRFTNWGSSVVAHPLSLQRPSTIEAIAELVASTANRGETLRVVGAGHSFTPVAATNGHLVSLDDFSGVVSVDTASKRVRFRAGTRLRDIPGLVEPYGLALANQGDIDAQSLAGALSTGTHGTGLSFTGFAGAVTALEIVTADGRVREVSRDREPELFHHARVSVGALGVLTEIEMQCVDAFDLVADEAHISFDDMCDTLVERARTVDHIDYFWFPYAEHAIMKSNTRVARGDAGPGAPARARTLVQRLIEEEVMDNAGLSLVNRLSRMLPGATPQINRLATSLASTRHYRGRSHEVFASPRRVRFREMEYAVPLEAGSEALREVRSVIESSGRAVAFPLEVRTSAGDDVPLSMAHEQECVYIAAHQYHPLDETGFFRDVEKVLRAAGGRPHWGKMHTLGADELAPLYPQFTDFLRVRDEYDPNRVFGSRYLTYLFGS